MSPFSPERLPESSVHLAPGQRAFGRYTLEREIGRGGMGVVWRARDDGLALTVALKFLIATDPEAVRDLKLETRRSLALTHPNIVRVYDFVQDGRSTAIAMEFVDGLSLARRKMDAPGRCLGTVELAPSVQQLCDALSYAHEQARIVHRDLKPSNLLLTSTGVLKVSDFGISASLAEAVTRVTADHSTSGTLPYMSPQQFMGESANTADDIYALGATLYELLTGKPPFFRGDTMSILAQVRERVPRPLEEHRADVGATGPPIPSEWSKTILACLEKEPARRPRSAVDVATRLGLETRGQISLGTSSSRPALGLPGGATGAPLRAFGAARRWLESLTTARGPVPVSVPTQTPSLPSGSGTPPREAPAPSALPDPPWPPPPASPQRTDVCAPEPERNDETGAFTLNLDASIRHFPVRELEESPPTLLIDARKLAADAFAEAGVFLQQRQLAAALEAYKRAAGGGHPRARQQLAWWQELQSSPNAGEAGGDDRLLQRVIENHAQMIFDEARDCENGKGRAQNLAKALKLYHHAAELGQPEALTRLGLLHLHGRGVDVNFVTAAAFFSQAAEHGHGPALLHLGRLFERGKGVRLDLKRAENCYERAVQAGDEDAQDKLDLLRSRLGTPAPSPETPKIPVTPPVGQPQQPPEPPEREPAGSNQVFVCYSRSDSRRVYPLVESLRKRGFNLWIDVGGIDGEGGIEAGSKWHEVIFGQIRQSKALLCLTSRSSLESDYVKKELAIAGRLHKAIIPALLDRIDEDEIPDDTRFYFIEIQYLQIHDDFPFETKLRRLEQALRMNGATPAPPSGGA